MEWTIICEHSVPYKFWSEVVSTSCHIFSGCLIRPILKKIPHKLWNYKRPNIEHFHVFRSKYFVHNNGMYNIGSFDPWTVEGIFMGYSNSSRSYRIFNKRTLCIKESVHVVFDDANISMKNASSIDGEIDLVNKSKTTPSEANSTLKSTNIESNQATTTSRSILNRNSFE